MILYLAPMSSGQRLAVDYQAFKFTYTLDTAATVLINSESMQSTCSCQAQLHVEYHGYQTWVYFMGLFKIPGSKLVGGLSPPGILGGGVLTPPVPPLEETLLPTLRGRVSGGAGLSSS